MNVRTPVLVACLACWLVGCGGTPSGGGPAPKVEVPSTPDGAVQTVFRSVGEGKPQAVWSALPPKYQADVKGLIVDFGGKMDKEVWDKTFVVLGKVTKLAKEKKEFILEHPFLAMTPLAEKQKKDEVLKNWDAVVSIFDIIVKSDISTVDGLKKLDPESFLGNTTAKLMPEFKRLAAVADQKDGVEKFEKLKETKVTVVKSEGDKATLKIEIPGEEAKEQEFTKVEGRWLPSKMVEEWPETIAEAKKSISEIKIEGPQKAEMLKALNTVDGSLDKLLAAKTQDEFNSAVGEIMAGAGSLMQGFGGGNQ